MDDKDPQIFSIKEATIYEIYCTTRKTNTLRYQQCAQHTLRAYMSGDILNFLITCILREPVVPSCSISEDQKLMEADELKSKEE